MEDTTVNFDDATKEYFSDEKLAILRKLAIAKLTHEVKESTRT
jgi:K+-sensing histidine kinase KdpD